MTKEQIIKVISDNLAKRVDKSIFTDRETDKRKIGNNQFRELANICKTAECYEEVELLVKYNIAKAGKISWGTPMDGSNFGSIVVENMQNVRNESVKCGDDVMKNLGLFFGYLYWNARIWTAENL